MLTQCNKRVELDLYTNLDKSQKQCWIKNKSKCRIICYYLYNIFKHIKHNYIYHHNRYIGKDIKLNESNPRTLLIAVVSDRGGRKRRKWNKDDI